MAIKKRPALALAAGMLALACCAAAEVPPEIHARLQQAGLGDDALAFVAQRVSDGRIVAAHGANRVIQPASTLKLLTSIVVLEQLGPVYAGRSKLLSAGRVSGGVLHGDLVLRGEGDVDLDAQAFERDAHPRNDISERPDPRAVALTKGVDDPRPDAGVALAGVVEQTGEQDLVVADALGSERGDDVETVPAIGDVHRVEQCELRGRQPGDQSGPLRRRHSSADVRAELADPTRPPGSGRVQGSPG
jgi:hypothetical protein